MGVVAARQYMAINESWSWLYWELVYALSVTFPRAVNRLKYISDIEQYQA